MFKQFASLTKFGCVSAGAIGALTGQFPLVVTAAGFGLAAAAFDKAAEAAEAEEAAKRFNSARKPDPAMLNQGQ